MYYFDLLFVDISKSLIFTEMGTRRDPKKLDVSLRNLRNIMGAAQGLVYIVYLAFFFFLL